MKQIDRSKPWPEHIPTHDMPILPAMTALCNVLAAYTKATQEERKLDPKVRQFIRQKISAVQERIALNKQYVKSYDLQIDYITLTELMNIKRPEWIKEYNLLYCRHPDSGLLGFWYAEGFAGHGIPAEDPEELKKMVLSLENKD